MEITTVYQKEWQDFGRPVNTFAMSDVTVLDEFLPDPPLKDQHIERNPTILDIQAIPEMSESHVSCAAPALHLHLHALAAHRRTACRAGTARR